MRTACRSGRALACVLAAACAPEPLARAEPAGRDSAGVRIVENPAEDRALTWELERRLTLGSVEGGPEAFYQIDGRSVAFDSEGRVYVLDKGNKRVAVFDSLGTFVHQFGQAGDAPDAFRFPQAMWLSPTGHVEVLDFAHAAIKRFGREGRFATSRPINSVRLGMSGRVEATSRGLVFDGQEGLRSYADTVTLFVAYVAASDTVRIAQWRKRGTRDLVFADCRVRYGLHPFFSPEINWDASRDRIVVNSQLGYVLDVFAGDSLALSIRRPIGPLPVSDEDVRRVAEPWTRFEFGTSDGENRRVCTKDLDEVVRERRYESERQTIAEVAMAPGGALWARRTGEGEEDGPTDVFDPSGRYMGTLPPSTPFPIAFTPSGEIVTRELDELDVEHLVFYRVREDR